MHTVEKIGGTSMSRFRELMDTILIGERTGETLYNRIFVVSAYGGITNLLLEHKKTGEPGVYARFANAENESAWREALTDVRARMADINLELFGDSVERVEADRFITQRITDVETIMSSLQQLCSHGHFQLDEHLMKVREMLAAIGEAHSAHNSVLALKKAGVNARFVDLSGWDQPNPLPFDEMIEQSFKDIDVSREMPIVTGYTHCSEGLMRTFDRGYSEMTFSKIATKTGAAEAVIHKEFHLSTADPGIVGLDNVVTIGRTNYDVADQLSNLGMEAIHPKAAKGLRQQEIELRIKNAFEPDHDGTVISTDYCSAKPQVEIIAGRPNVFAIEIFDQDMLGEARYDIELSRLLQDLKLYVVNRDSDANSITYFVAGSRKMVNRAVRLIGEKYNSAEVGLHKVAIVSAIGSDLKVPGILAKTVSALAKAGISVQALHQSMRQVEMQCIVNQDDYESAVRALHHALIEQEEHGDVICAA
ncbi:MAG: aspartate kinase [Oceanospirillales bacterium]|uniref:aspartate kinase n=1 Tax=Marinobacterium halophilum TaxID=267374 RepID=A0A2P8F0F2_9GAMM|nr:aspartate kinase [Marinobacterium halophilum]MBR9829237.1 aspartate kinase [Oceanospirillales bacterium]PSL15202.1 aspartate kinase [Marinobacterium halophilum]